MTVKLLGFIPRHEDQTAEEFHDYYHHPHSAMGRNNRRAGSP